MAINNYVAHIVLGDFSHYCTINKWLFSIKILVELFTKYNQIGYIVKIRSIDNLEDYLKFALLKILI